MPTEERVAHTKGPWKVAADPCHFDSLTTIYGGEALALKAEVGGTADIAELEANARLIAAAPDLLKAARGVGMLYAELFAAVPRVVNTPAWDLVQSIVTEADAAIAKAEGR